MFEEDNYLGTLVGNTGNLTVQVALRDSYSVRRGEFVRVMHKERKSDDPLWVLGRMLRIGRENILYNPSLGEGVSDIELVVSKDSGETVYGVMELIGYRDPETGEIKIPRRPLDPGSHIYSVDFEFLQNFYEYSPDTSIHIGNLVGYEKGENVVPVYIDIDKIVTEHLAVLAMTGAGKSYTIGRIIERMLVQSNASIVVFDPHGEYGNVFKGGKVNFAEIEESESLSEIQNKFKKMQADGGGIKIYAPRDDKFRHKYNNKYTELALQIDGMDVDELQAILPEMTEPQERVLSVAIRYWLQNYDKPRDTNELLRLLTEERDKLKNWSELYESERKALNDRSASIIALRLRRVINEARSFYEHGQKPFDVHEMVGRKHGFDNKDNIGRIAIVDMQGLSKTAMQIIVALIGNEIMKASTDQKDPIRPVFVVVEEGHLFAPAKESGISKSIISKMASEGRKFGVGLAIVSQRPSKLDADVTSQCNTIIAMRIKNPDDQRFIRSTSDFFSEADINELPALSTGEALICGRAIVAPLIVKVGLKALIHGGESPKVCKTWKQGQII